MNKLLAILITILLSFVLMLSTFTLGSFSPDWTQLFLIYWVLATPMNIGLFSSWIIGLLVDVIIGSTLGINALMYTIVSFLITKIHHIVRYITVFQQSIVIFFILLIKVTFILWVEAMLSIDNQGYSIYWGCLTSALFWPFVFYFLRNIRRRYNISE
tara:strand:+ start:874 stop:1344 length:471 start_codon:yes stop_codon:yes gene_type:complete